MDRSRRRMLTAAVFVAASGWLAAACASSPKSPGDFVTVTVDFGPDRPKDVFLTVSLVEQTEAGEQRVMGRSIERLVGLGPAVEIRVSYDPDAIDPRKRYEAQAAIDRQGTVLLVSPGAPVLTRGNPDSARVRIRPTRPWPIGR